MQGKDLAADLFEAGLLALNPFLAGLQPCAAVGTLPFGNLLLGIDGLLLARSFRFPGLPLRKQYRAILIELPGVFIEDCLGRMEQLIALLRAAEKFRIQLLAL